MSGMRKLKRTYLAIIIFHGVIFVLSIIFIHFYYDSSEVVRKREQFSGSSKNLRSHDLINRLSLLNAEKEDDYEEEELSQLQNNSSLIGHKIRFYPHFPTVLRGWPGNDFENVTLKMDSVQKNFCDNSTFVISIVPSATTNYVDRRFIRNTWGSTRLYNQTRLRVIFVLGATVNSTLQDQLEKEAQTYGDILQMNYIDSYANLTYKTIVALLWISENCKVAPWILKVDDDVVLNPFNLKKALGHELKRDPSARIILGRLRPHSAPFRSGKWGVSVKDYNRTSYPPFVLGSAYIVGSQAVDSLIKYAYETPFFQLEDVYTTGFVAKKAKVHLRNIERTYFVVSSYRPMYRGKAIFLVGESLGKRQKVWKVIIKFASRT